MRRRGNNLMHKNIDFLVDRENGTSGTVEFKCLQGGKCSLDEEILNASSARSYLANSNSVFCQRTRNSSIHFLQVIFARLF